MNTQNTRTFGRRTNLTDALVMDVRRVLIEAFENRDFYTVRMVAGSWVERCHAGHASTSRVLPIAQRAMCALRAAEAGLDYSFEG